MEAMSAHVAIPGPEGHPRRPVEQRETKREKMPKRHHHRGAEIRKNQPEIYIKMDIYGDAICEESWRDAAGGLRPHT
jgi:hypothetical protein